MRLIVFRNGDGKPKAGVLLNEYVVDISEYGDRSTVDGWLSLLPEARADLASVLATGTLPQYALADVRLEAPVRNPTKLIAIGVNYLDHCREQGIEPPREPLVFSKFPSSITGPQDMIIWDPTLTQQVDPEIELGVVIGRRCRAVSTEEALSYVFGYTVVDDVSARDLQFGDGQWARGKSLDTFCPIGPCVVTADEIPDPQNLRLRLWVNDRLQQEGTTADMIFSVAQIVAHISRFATLEPGDLITTGTPKGVGCFRDPPIYLASGDIVRCAIEGIGELVNLTRAATAVSALA
jgi:2-keto-4-pentenoate hydratase/2-oxohepta-3-ene-1,7-dioic acid hydratase in catechol pathway